MPFNSTPSSSYRPCICRCSACSFVGTDPFIGWTMNVSPDQLWFHYVYMIISAVAVRNRSLLITPYIYRTARVMFSQRPPVRPVRPPTMTTLGQLLFHHRHASITVFNATIPLKLFHGKMRIDAPPFLSLDVAVASRSVFIIVSGSEGRTGGNAFGAS